MSETAITCNGPTLALYNLSNYTFGIKVPQLEEDPSVAARLARLSDEYDTHGMRNSVEAVLLVHEHGHPHILTLQIGDSFFKLPGGTLNPGEEEDVGLKRLLNQLLAPTSNEHVASEAAATDDAMDWRIGECLGTWFRPNFENFMYPYLPPHITKPKEQKKIFLIHLPNKRSFAVPKNMKLLAVPIFELYENQSRYGPHISSVPHLLSRFDLLQK